jgi:hypothetical protein
MNKKLYLIVFLGFLAISFYPHNKRNFVISANKKLVNDTVKALTKEDIMGKYVSNDVYNFCELNLHRDTFNSVSGGCTYEIQELGKWDFQNNTLYFSGVCSKSEDCIFSYFSKKESQEEYTIIRQDSFLILINKSWNDNYLSKLYKEICKLHNAGLNATHSTFLHKKLENHTPVPIPTIPTEYHKFLLKKSITCKVTTIENDTTITINVGKEDGVFEGLQFHKRAEFKKDKKQKPKKGFKNSNPLFLTFEVISCETHSSIIKPIADFKFEFLIIEKTKKLQIGDTLCSKRK